MTNFQRQCITEHLKAEEKDEGDALHEFTPARLQTLLKYFRIIPGFLKNPANYPRTLNLIANDLNESTFQKSATEILHAIEHWKTRVGLLTADPSEPARPTDRELQRLLMALETRLTHSQITLILQHMEVVGSDADGLWATIAVEMRALKHPPRPEVYWRRGFEEWCSNARDQFRDDPEAVTALQQRFIDFAGEQVELADNGSGPEVDALELVMNHCRTCLKMLRAADPKAYLFEAAGTETTLADKINVCFGTEMGLEERLPKYVCRKCVEKVEGAYALKMQIDRTGEELQNLIGEYRKTNTVVEADMKNEHCEEIVALEFLEEHAEMMEEKYVEPLEEEVPAEDNILYNWEEVYDNEMIVGQEEHEDVSETHEAECSDVVLDGEEDYLEADEEETYVNQESKKRKPKSKKKAPRKNLADLNDKFYPCPECKVILRTYELWKAHRARHVEEKRYTCKVCSKQFRSSTTLRIHQRTHTNERPYVCEICSKSFVQSTNLVYHMKVHRDIRNYPCDQCAYKARNKNDLNLHKRTHSGARPYVCVHCECPFTTSSNLSKHIRRRHMGEKKFQCKECEKTFTTKETAQKHMVRHTGKKPYSCPECSSTYGWYNGLQKHMKSMHPGVSIPTEKTMIVASLAAADVDQSQEGVDE
ncbi:zinc finger and SCAN domain-containing protein 21-like isoform X2 [Armigeres subalbatus]|uniref:zinc finger and SCAN domain-containing protein 21-like isoform X2 n=1 Tax=Armigeres subalbatus TaxID=124917 RepID=UPI002ED184B9